MTLQDIDGVFAANIKNHRTNMIIVLVVGGIFLITGICLGLFMDHDQLILLSIFGGMGLLFGIIGLVALVNKGFEKRTQGIKDILHRTPQLLVWSYVLQQNNRGAVTVSVVMCFKDGKTFMVDQNAIPHKDTTGFMHLLRTLNPSMHMGYSEELDYKFKQRTL